MEEIRLVVRSAINHRCQAYLFLLLRLITLKSNIALEVVALFFLQLNSLSICAKSKIQNSSATNMVVKERN